jgi:hypothetical protein
MTKKKLGNKKMKKNAKSASKQAKLTNLLIKKEKD